MFSHARLTYTQVSALIEGNSEESGIDESLQPAISNLYYLSKKLGARRRQSGAIEFEIPEPIIIFDEERKIERVEARVRNDAHRLIEECMLAANICASLMLDDSDVTGIYRGGEQPTPKDFSKVIAQIDDPLTSKIVQTALLRSMKQARYDVENSGHFALNFDSYTHFTSPIRRYPDLLVHRQIRKLLDKPNHQDDDESATREAVQWLKCEFMSHKIGENLFGIVSSVTDFGLFVELEEFYVDGLRSKNKSRKKKSK